MVLGHQQRSELNMWLLIAEMVLALGLIVFIMWWTLRARVDHPVEKSEKESSKTDAPPNKD
jgi:flagellar basal body-associated protein FliL